LCRRHDGGESHFAFSKNPRGYRLSAPARGAGFWEFAVLKSPTPRPRPS
jgi:hypothetical protein